MIRDYISQVLLHVMTSRSSDVGKMTMDSGLKQLKKHSFPHLIVKWRDCRDPEGGIGSKDQGAGCPLTSHIHMDFMRSNTGLEH